MRRSRLIKLFGLVVFWILVVTLNLLLEGLFFVKSTYRNSPWPSTNTYNGFYKMKRDTIDVIFLGSSVTVNGFCPQEIYDAYGIRSYNLGSEQQSIFLSYYWLKEALRFQSPQVVVLDTKFLKSIHPEYPLNTSEGLTRKTIDPMKWSRVKVEAVHDIVERSTEFASDSTHEDYNAESEISYYFKGFKYHTRWKDGLNADDFDVHGCEFSELKGWSTEIYYADPDYNRFTPYEYGGATDTAELDELQVEYLYKMGELCKQNGIKLILVSLPASTSDAVENAYCNVAEKAGAEYYNFGEKSIYQEIGAQLPKESILGHPNYWGSVKLSRYIGKMLSEKYNVAPVADEQYEATRDFYLQVAKDANLQYIEDFDQYLDAIKDPNYTLFFAINEDGTKTLTSADKEKLKSLGVKSDLENMYGYSWYAVITPEGNVAEELSIDETLDKSGKFGRKLWEYSIESAGVNTNAVSSSIMICDKEYAHNSRGINIVVWDNQGQTVIDSVTFDTCGDRLASRSWFVEMQKNDINLNAFSRW